YPVLNASVDGNDIVYHGFFDIGIAVGSPRGLVVPILRNADQMSFADIEKKIAEYGTKARDGKLSLDELTGGTFSISNGGVFGSMLSTPIINPPQSAILGVHATKDRAVVENGQVVVRPINYLAMSYDHRIIDGREAALGRTCTNIGCIPSKALLQSSEHFEHAGHHFADHGIGLSDLRIDVAKMLGRKNTVVKQNNDGILYLFKKNKVTFFHGRGSFAN